MPKPDADAVDDSFADSPEVNKTATNSVEEDNDTERGTEPEGATHEDDSIPSNGNHTVLWDTYIALLMKVSSEQLENVKRNVKIYYKLNKDDLQQVDKAFNNSGNEYEHFLQFNLKRIVEKKQFNVTDDFMIDFMDISNYLMEQIISYDLFQVKGKLELPTKWYKQVMREKIVRQQVKIATNIVEAHLCTNLHVCKDRSLYTQFLTEWLRHLLNLSMFNLKNLFDVIPELLEKHMHTVKSNVKFKKTVKYIVDAGETS